MKTFKDLFKIYFLYFNSVVTAQYLQHQCSMNLLIFHCGCVVLCYSRTTLYNMNKHIFGDGKKHEGEFYVY